jgi:2-methylcitrate dehydratase PrpD
MEIAKTLAKWIVKTEIHKIPPEVIEKAKKCILDSLGVTIAGAIDDVGVLIRDHVQALGGKPECTVLGTSIRTACPMAALANGTMGHALDFDDTSHSYIGHVTVCVLPAAIAVGEMVEASGGDITEAYIIGTEVACKLGAMITTKIYEDGWHSTCVIGAFGAAAAAGKLLGLTEKQIVHALGITVSGVSGMRGTFGSSIKPFQVGRSSESGVISALLAKRGMTASPEIFEKDFGFCHTFKVSRKFEPFYSKMGKPYDIDRPGFYLKEFPSCSSTHPALNAVIRLIKKHRIEPMQVESVDCAATPLVVSSLVYPNPKDAFEARFSMHFCLAVALLNKGRVSVEDFQKEKVRDPETIRVMNKINLRTSPDLEQKGFAPSDGPEAAIVTISMKGGQRYRSKNAFADWRPDNMPSWQTLTEKFRVKIQGLYFSGSAPAEG